MMRYRVIVTESGNQVMVRDLPDASIDVIADDDPVVDDHCLEISPAEFSELSAKAATNSIRSVKVDGKMLRLHYQRKPRNQDTN